MKPLLTIPDLIRSATTFCETESRNNHRELIGVTDGKHVGTYIEHKFKSMLLQTYDVEIGNSASGIDLPGTSIETDIKVTSISQPQSSCPYKNGRQKVFGLGYNLLVFVYRKNDIGRTKCCLHFDYCTFIKKERTADYTTTASLRDMIDHGANKEDIVGFLQDRQIPGDEIVYNALADEILATPPQQGYLTISNALQWRLQYKRVIELNNTVEGISNYAWQA